MQISLGKRRDPGRGGQRYFRAIRPAWPARRRRRSPRGERYGETTRVDDAAVAPVPTVTTDRMPTALASNWPSRRAVRRTATVVAAAALIVGIACSVVWDVRAANV